MEQRLSQEWATSHRGPMTSLYLVSGCPAPSTLSKNPNVPVRELFGVAISPFDGLLAPQLGKGLRGSSVHDLYLWSRPQREEIDARRFGTLKATANIDPKTGTRSTAATDYIVPALDPPNLKVFTTAYVNRILTEQDGDDVIATGVEFEDGGDVHVVHAANRVILCGCTSKSPHIVGLNGIGNCNVLEDLGIPVHLLNSAETKVEHGFVTSETITSPEVQTELRSIYIEAAGPLSLACTGVAFLSLHTFTERADELIEKVEKRIKRTTDKLSPVLKEQYELHLKLLKDKNVPDFEIFVFPFNVHPAGSRKRTSASSPRLVTDSLEGPFSSNTKVQPTIEPNYPAGDIDSEIKFFLGLPSSPARLCRMGLGRMSAKRT
ncbi:hypothetical protein BD311DRAFT_809413 [Dichomitus squalens]|uniref:Glucose-methanol-choline oxidoreductase N-terminal domain-containing protein n=1 Tax=Dichomitus squalens TaxID=114155 RepID=A0A4Q9MH63_9APHY|nr:hypothetical protein BD311DRAFT_809413 [Dichomitus squalens]